MKKLKEFELYIHYCPTDIQKETFKWEFISAKSLKEAIESVENTILRDKKVIFVRKNGSEHQVWDKKPKKK